MKNKLIVLGSVLFLTPVLAFAQASSCGAGGGTNGVLLIVCKIGDVLSAVVPILIVLAVIYFIWGVIKYVVSGDQEDKDKGRSMIIYGLIGLVVIIGMWGIVNMLINTLDVKGSTTIAPVLPRNQ